MLFIPVLLRFLVMTIFFFNLGWMNAILAFCLSLCLPLGVRKALYFPAPESSGFLNNSYSDHSLVHTRCLWYVLCMLCSWVLYPLACLLKKLSLPAVDSVWFLTR